MSVLHLLKSFNNIQLVQDKLKMPCYIMFDSGFNFSKKKAIQISENWLHLILRLNSVLDSALYLQREENGCLLILIDNVNLIQI